MTPGNHPTLPPPPDDQAGHPGLDALADLDAGLPDPAAAARLTRHVANCSSCAATLRTLESVRADLRSLPALRLPDAVAARLDATLAELRSGGPERQQPAASAGAHRVGAALPSGGQPARAGEADQEPGSPPLPGGADADDLTRARERRQDRSRRLITMVAASVVVLAAAVGVGTAVLTQSSSNGRVNQAGALSPEEGPASGGPGNTSKREGPGRYDNPAPSEASEADRLPAYTKHTLRNALSSIVTQFSLGVVTAEGPAGPAGAMADEGRRDSCAGSIPGTVGRPTAVQQVTFEGERAFVFVYEDAVRGRSAVVVGADCGLGGSPRVLYRLPG